MLNVLKLFEEKTSNVYFRRHMRTIGFCCVTKGSIELFAKPPQNLQTVLK